MLVVHIYDTIELVLAWKIKRFLSGRKTFKSNLKTEGWRSPTKKKKKVDQTHRWPRFTSTHSLNPYTYIYVALLMIHGDVLHYFSIRSSFFNQRIECYWSRFAVDRPGWWKPFFQDMVDLEMFYPSEPALLDCIRFCFISILRKELTDIANEWNQHLLSSERRSNTPSGRPDIM